MCNELTRYSKAINRLSSCSCAKANWLVGEVVSSGIAIAECYQAHHQVLLHELFLRRVFFDLLNKICDPLINQVVRRICLDHVYKPLFALKRFYRQHHGELSAYYQLERELRILSIEFLQSKG